MKLNWFLFLLVGLTIWSLTALFDRYALSQRVSDERLYVFVPSLIHLPMAVFLAFSLGVFSVPSFLMIISGVVAGFLEAGQLYYLFSAISVEEVSRAFPLGALSSVIVLIGSWVLLGDPLSSKEMLAFVFFVLGGFLLAFKYSAASRIDISDALIPAGKASLIGAAEILTLKFLFESVPFWSGLVTSRAGFMMAGFTLFMLRRDELMEEWSSLGRKLKFMLPANQLVAVFGHVFYYFSIKLQNAALVSAATGLQYGILFVLATFLSFWKPSILEESLERRELVKKTTGIVFIVFAIYLMNV